MSSQLEQVTSTIGVIDLFFFSMILSSSRGASISKDFYLIHGSGVFFHVDREGGRQKLLTELAV